MRRTRPLTLLAFAAALTDPLPAQSVRGRLIEDGSDKSIAGASLRMLDETNNVVARTVTDSTGGFLLEARAAGRYKLAVDAEGYRGTVTPAFSLEEGTQIIVRYTLSPTVILLAPLEITARSRPLISGMTMQGFNERRAKGQGFAITREQIDQRHARLVSDLLRMVPGVRVEWRFGGSRITVTGSSRAARGNCAVRVLLDGIEFRWGSTTIDDIPTFDIEAIEVFRSIAELPPEMAGPESSCGVIAIWTRRGR